MHFPRARHRFLRLLHACVQCFCFKNHFNAARFYRGFFLFVFREARNFFFTVNEMHFFRSLNSDTLSRSCFYFLSILIVTCLASFFLDSWSFFSRNFFWRFSSCLACFYENFREYWTWNFLLRFFGDFIKKN